MVLQKRLQKLAKKLGLEVNDAELFVQAFTHSSVCKAEGDTDRVSYRFLEWRGDALLAYAIRDLLARRRITGGRAARMYSYFGSNYFLAHEIARPLHLASYALITENARPDNGHAYKLEADLVEALIGFVALDQGVVEAVQFATGLVEGPMTCIITSGLYDPIRLLQKKAGGKPEFSVAENQRKHADGYAFVATVVLPDGRSQSGYGSRATIARHNAARSALKVHFDIQLKDEDD